jgi:hypothetical protein
MGDTLMQPIQFPKVLAVEGKDELNFFQAVLKDMVINEVDIFDVGGKDKFKTHIEALTKMVGFDQVITLAIIRDAENDAKATFDSMCYVLTQNGLSIPATVESYSTGTPSVGIFLMPGDQESGMLEDLCLKTVSEHPATRCVNVFVDCVNELTIPPNIMSKAKAQVFLAAQQKIVNSVGLGAKRGYWNLQHEQMKPIRQFLEQLR